MANNHLSPRSVLDCSFKMRDGTVSDSEIVYITRTNTRSRMSHQGQEKVEVGILKKSKRKTMRKKREVDLTPIEKKADDDDWDPLGANNAMFEYHMMLYEGLDMDEDMEG